MTVAGGPSAAAASPAAAAEVAFLGGLHLSEGSAGTTAVTAALDTPPCEAVEPCVSSLPDERTGAGTAQAGTGGSRDEPGCVSSRLALGSEAPPQQGKGAAAADPASAAACIRSAVMQVWRSDHAVMLSQGASLSSSGAEQDAVFN